MIFCEALLIGIFLSLGIKVIRTDSAQGIIPNKILLSAITLGMIIDLLYYAFFTREYLMGFLINLFVLSIFAICMYSFHFWAAGDTKLLITALVLYPSRFYCNDNLVIEIEIVIYIFLIAYVYILADTLKAFLKKEKFYGFANMTKLDVKVFLKDYLISLIYLRGFSYLFSCMFDEIYYKNQLSFAFLNVFLAMMIHKKNVFKKWYGIIPMLIINVLFFQKWNSSIDLFSIIVLLFAFGLRYLANGYNYQEISTDSVSKGMVLSYFTVSKFLQSRVKGLPKYTTEDMSSRISEEEAFAIKRWKDSKYGTETIVIVKKIPFAIFIIMGFLFHFAMEIMR